MGDDAGALRRLLLAWTASRAFVLTIILLPGFRQDVADLHLNHHLSTRIWCDGQLPGRDFPWEYPPGAIPFAAPPLGCGDFFAYVPLFISLVLLLDLATMLALRRLPRGRAAARVWVWSVVLLGPIALTRFDVAVCLMLVLAVLVLAGHPRTAGALLAAAASAKVWPAFVLAAALRVPGRRRVVTGAVAAAAALLAVFALSHTWHAFDTTRHYQQDRGLQIEAVAALPFDAARLFGLGDVTFTFGSWEVHAPGTAGVATVSGYVQLLAAAMVVALGLRRRPTTTADVALLGSAVVAVLLVTNKVLSPQYVLWLLAALAAAVGSGAPLPRHWKGLVATASVATQLLYPAFYGGLLEAEIAPFALLAVRNATLLVLTALLVRAALSPRPRDAPTFPRAQAPELV